MIKKECDWCEKISFVKKNDNMCPNCNRLFIKDKKLKNEIEINQIKENVKVETV